MTIAFIKENIEKFKGIHEHLLQYLESDEDGEFVLFKEYVNDLNIRENKQELIILLCLIDKISENHSRSHDLINKIKQIIKEFQNEIQNYYDNNTLFNIFKHNKLILLYLFEEEILKVDKSFLILYNRPDYKIQKYLYFFYPEFHSYFDKYNIKIDDLSEDDIETIKKLRKSGENNSRLCQLIRDDLLDDFIVYINKYDVSPSASIKKTFYDTNPLLQKETSLIEYAAFYGSIRIFNYLYKKDAIIQSKLWLYSVHSNNDEIIALLENTEISPTYESYIESIKCHYINLARYLHDNYFTKNDKKINFITKNYKNSILYLFIIITFS